MINATKYTQIKLSKTQQRELAPVMHSWRTVYPAIKDLNDSDESLNKLAEMLAYETRNPEGPRTQLLTRLHMRINAMRQRIEYNDVIKLAKR